MRVIRSSSLKAKNAEFCGMRRDSEYLKGKIGKPEEYNSHLFLGNSNSVLASRISYFMDLKGRVLP